MGPYVKATASFDGGSMTTVIESESTVATTQPSAEADDFGRSGSLGTLTIAYLMNQHPSPSVSFIRREIIGLENAGATVARFSIRRWSGQVVDPADKSELKQTEILLDRGALLILDVIVCCLQAPRQFLRAVKLCFSVGWKSDRGLLRTSMYFVEACRLKRRLAACGIDWVHAHFGTNSAAVVMFCRVLGGPRYSFTVHGPEEFDRPELLHLREKIRYASLVIAISHFCRSQLYRWCEWSDWPKINIVRCGISETFACREVLPISELPHLVCVARLAEQKGLPILIEAAAKLHRHGIDFQLELIGDGDLRFSIEKLLDEHCLRNKIKLSGWRTEEQIRKSIESSRALVLPSFAEGLPVVFMESLALGRPVIGTRIAGVSELVTDGECGWLVDAGDPEALAAAMYAALTTETCKLEAMGMSGRARVLEMHLAAREAVRLGTLVKNFQ
jgi:colanic acid/amylovoran biosynthesis glycosyltransferase